MHQHTTNCSIRQRVDGRKAVSRLILAGCLSFSPALFAHINHSHDYSDGRSGTETRSTIPASAIDRDIHHTRELIELSRKQADLSHLSQAKILLQSLPKDSRNHEIKVLRAIIAQRLHRFDEAKELLLNVRKSQPDHLQATLTLYSIHLIKGELNEAGSLCGRLGRIAGQLMAISCRANLQALQGNEEAAFSTLKRRLQEGRSATNGWVQTWAMTTLAEIASDMGIPEASSIWAQLLLQNPSSPYAATEYGAWLISQGDYSKGLHILGGAPPSERVEVLKVIAMKHTNHPDTEVTARRIKARLTNDSQHYIAHERELALFLLDYEANPAAALRVAQANWAKQKARQDKQLLERARSAAMMTSH